MKKILYFAAAALIAASCAPKLSSNTGKTAIVAHRGYWNCEEAGFAQNSIAALHEAQKAGFWGSECDIHITADDVVVVNHNNDYGPEKILIQKNNFSDLVKYPLCNGETIPTFDEYCAQAAKSTKTILVVEFKGQYSKEREDALVEKSIAILKAHGIYKPSRVAFISFSKYISCKIAEIAPEFTNQYLNGELSPEKLHELGINGLDYHHGIFALHPDWIEKAHELGMSVNVWTVNKDTMMQNFIGAGVDAITTNEPLALRALLGEKELVK